MNLRSISIAMLMVGAATLAIAMRPSEHLAAVQPISSLETLIPKQIGEWKVDERIVPIEPSPELKAQLNKIYNQTLSRTYVNGAGQHVMLSIAYGGDQSDSMRVHRPEVCYAAQGFEIRDVTATAVQTKFGNLPVTRLVASQQTRLEPITYWIVVGGEVTRPGLSQKLAQLKYGLTGRIADGMLVRISTIDRDFPTAYNQHATFADSLLAALPESERSRIAGVFEERSRRPHTNSLLQQPDVVQPQTAGRSG